jgi:hypothetical protein
MKTLDFELLLKISAAIIGAVGLLYQLRNLRLTFRSSIKTDLEILKMLEPNDPNYEIVRENINDSIKRVYGDPNKKRFKIYSQGDFYGGLMCSIMFSYWTYYLCQDGFSFWGLLTGLIAAGGIGGIITGLEPKKTKTKTFTSSVSSVLETPR